MVNASTFLTVNSSSSDAQYLTEEFLTPGTFGWIVPTGITRILVSVVGAGGSGGCGGGAYYRGGGGGGGAYTEALLDVVAGQTFTVVVGAGGATVESSAGSLAGNTGGSSSFSGNGTNMVSTGGIGGGGYLVGPNPALGGTATGGDKNFSGGNAGAFIDTSNPVTGGGTAGWPGGNGFASPDASGSGYRPGGNFDGLPRPLMSVPPFEYPGLFGTKPHLIMSNGITHIGDFLGYEDTTGSTGICGGKGNFGSNTTSARAGGIGGGGGGAVAYSSAKKATSGKGGDGMISITYTDQTPKFTI